ncbi:hypothetical protein Cpir12675_003175 [Ceratocystis pirilliformis]|uniref:Uncharacterized protein n=1 Tax=Ceratocystis pirilliformis TaxID=259994 RepID=A0ABR3Z5Q1_9PEZI
MHSLDPDKNPRNRIMSNFSLESMAAMSTLDDEGYFQDSNGITYQWKKVTNDPPSQGTTVSLPRDTGIRRMNDPPSTSPPHSDRHQSSTTSQHGASPSIFQEDYRHMLSSNFAKSSHQEGPSRDTQKASDIGNIPRVNSTCIITAQQPTQGSMTGPVRRKPFNRTNFKDSHLISFQARRGNYLVGVPPRLKPHRPTLLQVMNRAQTKQDEPMSLMVAILCLKAKSLWLKLGVILPDYQKTPCFLFLSVMAKAPFPLGTVVSGNL